MTCKFKMVIRGTTLFQCAADPIGWAYLYDIPSYRNSCDGCEKRVNGKPLTIDKEIKSADFWKIAGQRITAKDWKVIRGEG